MGGLKNKFSWSFSAAEDFEQCRRRRYWAKYGMWGGWNGKASEEKQTAYRLSKMNNRWGLMGQATENAVMWVIRERQAGKHVDAESAWDKVARPFLTQKWNESHGGRWRTDPKRFCCLRDHYYQTMEDENAAKREIAEQIKRCIVHFIEKVLPRISAVEPTQEFRIATPTCGGDVEHFDYEGVKIYSVPDYAYHIGKQIHIHDWKAGKIKASRHKLQLSIYALWAIVKHGVAPENIFLYAEYLNEGQVMPFQPTAAELNETKSCIGASVGEMTEYLVDFDRGKNEPLPKEEWEPVLDSAICNQCNFLEFCRQDDLEKTLSLHTGSRSSDDRSTSSG